MNDFPILYVTIRKLAELTGYTPDAIESKIKRRQWVEGKHYILSPDGRVQFSIEAYNAWLQEGCPVELRRAGKRSDLRSGSTARDSARP